MVNERFQCKNKRFTLLIILLTLLFLKVAAYFCIRSEQINGSFK